MADHGEGPSNPRQKYTSASLANPSVLDCCICKKALRIPTVQCQNGHVACSLCCVSRRNRCPICPNHTGFNRCRAIETILESFKISCPNARFGCEAIIPYHKQNDHKKECIFAPCICPHPSCTFVATSKKLAHHFTMKHTGSAISFVYGNVFSVNINVSDRAFILREQNDGGLFVLHNIVNQDQGHRVYVNCVAPNSCNSEFTCKFSATSPGLTQKAIVLIPNHQGHIAFTPEFGFLRIPSDAFDSGQLKLDLCIRRGDSLDLVIDLFAK